MRNSTPRAARGSVRRSRPSGWSGGSGSIRQTSNVPTPPPERAGAIMQPMRKRGPRRARPVLTDEDLHLFNEGTHDRAYEKLGAHPGTRDGEDGTYFAVWAPNAERVSVIGDFNGWKPDRHPLRRAASRASGRASSPASAPGPSTSTTSSRATTATGSTRPTRSPSAPRRRRSTASIVWDLDYDWGDGDWMAERARAQRASTRRSRSTRCTSARGGACPRTGNRSLTYRELAPRARRLRRRAWASPTSSSCRSWSTPSTARGATRPPATSRPPAATARPQDFMYLIDMPAPARHRRDPRLGALALPDRRARPGLLRRHAPLRARRPAPGLPPRLEQPTSSTTAATRCAASCSRSALFWLDQLPRRRPARRRRRLDALPRLLAQATASGSPTSYGGRENLEAIAFLRQLNEDGLRGTSRTCRPSPRSRPPGRWCRGPTYVGGLGFGLKWDMGWMHDTLRLHVAATRSTASTTTTS